MPTIRLAGQSELGTGGVRLLDIEIGDRIVGIDHHGNSRELRIDLLEIFEPLADKFEAEIGKTRGVAAGMADALDKLGPDRIGDIHEDHRDGRGGLLDIGRRSADADQHVGRERDQLGRHALELLRLLIGETVDELDLALGVTE